MILAPNCSDLNKEFKNMNNSKLEIPDKRSLFAFHLTYRAVQKLTRGALKFPDYYGTLGVYLSIAAIPSVPCGLRKCAAKFSRVNGGSNSAKDD